MTQCANCNAPMTDEARREIRLFARFCREQARDPIQTLIRWWKYEGFTSKEQAWRYAQAKVKAQKERV